MPLQRDRPLLCLVTDRRRLPPDPAEAASLEALIEFVGAAAREGIDLVHVRERDLSAAALTVLVERLLDAVRGTGARVVVNDRLDVAITTGAHGVHLRADSFAADRVRKLAPAGFLVGRSVHSEREALSTAGEGDLDYLVLGTIFASLSKPAGHTTLGLDPLRRVAHAVDIPVLAIGGITRETLPDVLQAGAAGVAAIRLFASPPADLGAATREVRRLSGTVCAGRRDGKLTAGLP